MKKIMFNDKYGLTKAVLNGIKTQTRRLVNPQPTYDERVGIVWKGYAYGIRSSIEDAYRNFVNGTEYPKVNRYKINEILAIAQKYSDIGLMGFESHSGFHNKMFVKAEYMPHQIVITKIGMERLQDISDEDCLKEGIIKKSDGYYINNVAICFTTPKEAYKYLINKICGNGTWDNNPYVWVYDFELCK